jgi:hypothetical protein
VPDQRPIEGDQVGEWITHPYKGIILGSRPHIDMAKKSIIRWKALGLKEEERLTAGLVHHRSPAWSADGRWLALLAGDHEPAWIVVDRRGRVARAFAGAGEPGASFASDGALAFSRKLGGGSEIWLATTPAAPPVRLLGGDGHVYRQPAFSPDGAQLAFVACEHERAAARLWLLDVKTGERHLLPTQDALGEHTLAWPAFSPDGSELFFDAQRDGGEAAVYALHFGRQDLQRIGAPDVPSRHPAPLSAELIVVERVQDGAARLVLVDRREVRERELTVEDSRLSELREPAVGRGKGKRLRLAFTAIVDDGSPVRRADVCAARLRGLALDQDELGEELAEEEPSETESLDEVPPTP